LLNLRRPTKSQYLSLHEVKSCTGLTRLPQGRRSDELRRRADELFLKIPSDGLPSAVADAYAEIKRLREQQGSRMDENDLWIAAAACRMQAALVTRDKDFGGIPLLHVIDWSVP
jgi:predicted nucleic acid-binding protein